MNSATENFIANIFTPPWSFSYKKIIDNVTIPSHIEKKLSYRLLKYKKATHPSPD